MKYPRAVVPGVNISLSSSTKLIGLKVFQFLGKAQTCKVGIYLSVH